ncbi:MAG: PAS domain S-box protein [gamma proteobacterium symbiont of Taylorina sp.]|nr:PAS domain S-box protein [gamma proteobacterium symbiont of Taylorina sp.]
MSLKTLFLALIFFSHFTLADDVVIAVRAHSGAEQAVEHWMPTIHYLQEKIPQHTFSLLPVESIDEMDLLFSRGKIDFVITQPVAYVDLEHLYGATRILTMIKKGGLDQFGSVIFSRNHDDNISNLQDIKNKIIAGVTKKGFGGWLIGYNELLISGIDAYKDCKQVIFSGSHEGVVEDVISGRADVGIVRTEIIETMIKNGQLTPDALRILNLQKTPGFPLLHSTSLYPEWAFAKAKHASPIIASDIVIHLLAIKSVSINSEISTHHAWSIPLDYNPVHELMKKLKVGSYASYGRFDIAEFVNTNPAFVLITLIFILITLTLVVLRFHQKNKCLMALTQHLQKVKQTLEISEEKTLTTLRSIGDAVISVDLNGHIIFINPVAENLTGWSNTEAIGQALDTVFNIINDETHLRIESPVQKCLKQEKIISLENNTLLIKKDGSEITIEDSAAPIISHQNIIIGVVLVFRDVTQSNRMALKLKNQTQETVELWSLIEDSKNEIYIFDKNLHFIHVNKGARQNLGYSNSELKNLTPFDIKKDMSKKQFIELILPLTTGQEKILNFETIHQRKDGSTYPVEVNLQYSHFKEQPVFVAFILDITIRNKTEEQLRQAQKMEAIGQLSGGIAHDFNNLLGIIIGNLGFLERLVKGNDISLRKVDAAYTAALRAADLTKQLLGFSRKQEHLKKTSNINQIINDVDRLINRSVTPEISVEYHFVASPYLTDIDPGAFKDSILNLVLNARDVMPDGGRLTIETRNKTLDQSYVSQHPDVKAGDYIECIITDTGCGISDEEMTHIFEPFYTTKAQGKGTGLGLSMVFGFFKRSKGHLKVYSEVDIGTSFHLFLPRSKATSESSHPVADEKMDLPEGNETILVVDDEPGLIIVACSQLKELGYKTLSAGTGHEAVKLLHQHKEINILFSDVIMPGGMNGYELAEQAELINPAIKVLLASGFTKKALVKNGQSRFAAHLLAKPYSFKELALGIRKAVNQSVRDKGETE